jgi:hypothetical protein
MTGNLGNAITELLAQELPHLFAGDPPLVTMAFLPGTFEIDPPSLDSQVSEPRPDDRVDDLPFNSENPAGPYTLTQPRLPGPLHVCLTTLAGDCIPLASNEVIVDPGDPRIFELALRPQRDLAGVTGVQAAYSVVAVYANIAYQLDCALDLFCTDPAALTEAEDMAIAVLVLNQRQIIIDGSMTEEEGDYGATITVVKLNIHKGDAGSPGQRTLHFHAEMVMKAMRALAPDEGKRILRIVTVPGDKIDVALTMKP